MALLKVMWSDVVLTKTVAVYAYWLISKSQTASDVQDAEIQGYVRKFEEKRRGLHDIHSGQQVYVQERQTHTYHIWQLISRC